MRCHHLIDYRILETDRPRAILRCWFFIEAELHLPLVSAYLYARRGIVLFLSSNATVRPVTSHANWRLRSSPENLKTRQLSVKTDCFWTFSLPPCQACAQFISLSTTYARNASRRRRFTKKKVFTQTPCCLGLWRVCKRELPYLIISRSVDSSVF